MDKSHGKSMPSLTDEFTLYAKAERQLCEAAAPVLGDLLRKIEAELGVHITELRVTVQRRGRDERGVTANCTIVSAQPIEHGAPWSSTHSVQNSAHSHETSPQSSGPPQPRNNSAD